MQSAQHCTVAVLRCLFAAGRAVACCAYVIRIAASSYMHHYYHAEHLHRAVYGWILTVCASGEGYHN
eukprot:5662-Heterococcus_DN1.PRE.6